MKMKRFISVLVLAVYSIVLAHSFVPHHHHSEFVQNTNVCDHEQHVEHQKHSAHETEHCCVDHSNEHQDHSFCSFEEKIILTKSIDLSEFFIPSFELEFIGLENNNQSIPDCYPPIQISSPHCRDVQLRGPPQFS